MQITEQPIEQIRNGIRLNVCPDCSGAVAEGTAKLPDAPRRCETGCDVFLLLPRLCEMAERRLPEPPCGYEMAVDSLRRHAADSKLIDERVANANSPGLARHADATVAVINRVLEGRDSSLRSANSPLAQ